VTGASDVKRCYPSVSGQDKEHTKRWAFNTCRCKHCAKPPGVISITHDDYCERDPEQPVVECPTDVHSTYKIPGKCFFTHCPSQNMLINDARAWCESKGGALASIHTEADNTKILDMLNGRSAWIGALRVSGNGAWTQGDWVWEDGSDWVNPTWATDGLRSGKNSESRIAIHSDRVWHDWLHGHQTARGVVCQVVAKPAEKYPREGACKDVVEMSNYELVESFDTPQINQDWNTRSDVPFTLKKDPSSAIKRVAYCMKMGDHFAWASFDWTDANKIGMPVDFELQNSVSNVNVVSNHPDVVEGTGVSGNVEFWDHCYGHSNGRYDHNDDKSTSANCYGSMQVHSEGRTVLAFNGWSSGGHCDLQLGNALNNHNNRDGTFSGNCNSYLDGKAQVSTYVEYDDILES
jgi:hypothetical protein